MAKLASHINYTGWEGEFKTRILSTCCCTNTCIVSLDKNLLGSEKNVENWFVDDE